jgi:hypothetical protein
MLYQALRLRSRLSCAHRRFAGNAASLVGSASASVGGFVRRRRLGLGIVGAVAGTVAGARQYALHDLATLTDEGLSTEYDPEEIDAFWSHHSAVAVWRLFVIGAEALPFFAKLAWQATFSAPPPPLPAQRAESSHEYDTQAAAAAAAAVAAAEASRELRLKEAAEKFRLILTSLGPTFIKFGQMLSSRPDVLPTVVLQELQKLCDSVPA